jgi:hypothetical protein
MNQQVKQNQIGEMIVLITQLKETKVSSDPREKENKNADMKYELTFRKRDELELLWQACLKHMKKHIISQRKKNILNS